MSEASAITLGELNSAINRLGNELRSEFEQDLNMVRRELRDEINRLEEEMKQVGDMIVEAIHTQTLAVVEGVAQTTMVIDVTKRQIEHDFSTTHSKLDAQIEKIDTQIETTLQIEVGKKVAEAGSIRDKMAAFMADIRSRFDRSIITSAQNRELYNVAFRNLTDEYADKIRVIGEHIFKVRLEDIAPAVKAASVPYEEAHGLPIEMDLRRLEIRSAALDETLELLKSSRLDEVLASLDVLGNQLDIASTRVPLASPTVVYCVEGIATISSVATQVRSGLTAGLVHDGLNVNLSTSHPTLSVYNTEPCGPLRVKLAEARFRPTTGDEAAKLLSAARLLQDRQLISNDALGLFEDFVRSDSLNYLEV